MHEASGDIIVVAMDERAGAEQTQWPWPEDKIAETVELLFEAGARKIVLAHEVPVNASGPSTRLEELTRLHADTFFVVEPAQLPADAQKGRSLVGANYLSSAEPVHAEPLLRFWGGVDHEYYAMESEGRVLQSAAAAIAGQSGNIYELYPIDFSIDAKTIPFMSLLDLQADAGLRSSLYGKDVILGFEAPPNMKPIKLLGQGSYGMATLIAIQAETLKSGKPVVLPWYVAWFFGLAIAYSVLRARKIKTQTALLFGGLLGSFAVLVTMNSFGLYLVFANAWIMIIVVSIAGISRNLREKTRLENAVHPISGLPSTDALRMLERSDLTVMHAKIRRSSELLEILTDRQQKVLAEKVSRLLNPGTTVWHGDNGRYYWLAEELSGDTAQHHFQSLALIFRNGFSIDDLNVSLEVVFGLDQRKEMSMSDRVQGATMSAKQAIMKGVQWLAYEASDRGAAKWSVTLLRELDLAIENGHIYAALQPKLDLRTGCISGAEALARWHHPTKGLIRPDEFIEQADQGGRLLDLTLCVFENALSACAPTIHNDPDFVLSVNIAPSLLESLAFPGCLMEKVEKFGIDPRNIMLEVTESSQFADDEICSQTMQQLRLRGFELSIDDYGTANSTLEYLRKIPASELKIDRKFVSNMLENEADYHLVASTIQLGHRLRMLVVAEGVEDDKTLNTLQSLNCDIIQGYAISRPLDPPDFGDFLAEYSTPDKKLINL